MEVYIDDREKKIKTKFGNASIHKNNGYYQITSVKEGNFGKVLHRLIYEDFHKVTLLKWCDIHHKDGNKLNNDIKNLVAIPKSNHTRLHKKGVSFSDEHRKKIAEAITGCKLSEETIKKIAEAHKDVPLSENHKRNVSLAQNTSGYRNVYKQKDKRIKQGFTWCYRYYDENGKRKRITRVNIDDLKKEVLKRKLTWEEYN